MRHLRRSSPSRRQPTSAGGWARGWPPRASSTWPGRAAWTCAVLAGWLTAVCATPSPRLGPTAGATSWACGPSICTPTRRATPTPRPATTPSATQVGLGGCRAWEGGLRHRNGGPEEGSWERGWFLPLQGTTGTQTLCFSTPCFHQLLEQPREKHRKRQDPALSCQLRRGLKARPSESVFAQVGIAALPRATVQPGKATMSPSV